MSKTNGGEQVRLQLLLYGKLSEQLARHAEELERSQAWVANWAIGSGLDTRDEFAKWLGKRIRHPEKYQKWAEVTATVGQSRLQLKVDASMSAELNAMAAAMNHAPLKLAGLLIEYSFEALKPSLVMMKTNLGKFVRRKIRGPEDFTTHDVSEVEPQDVSEGE
jgi:hypothetical protein